MGKKQHSKDRLFITQTEHKYLYGGKKNDIKTKYKRLPFNYCAISLCPFKNPVATIEGDVFDIESIIPYIKQHEKNPVTGEKLNIKDLIKLNFSKNDKGEYFCPITFKPLTDNMRLAFIKTSGNVYSYEAIETLNLKNKNFHDLLNGVKFGRKEIITIQDPQNLKKREIENFAHFKLDNNLNDTTQSSKNIRLNAATDRILQEVEKKKKKRILEQDNIVKSITHNSSEINKIENMSQKKKIKFSSFTDGTCSRSFTSSVYTPSTVNQLAPASKEELLTKRWNFVKKLKKKGFISIITSHGKLNIQLDCDFVPMTCDNFLGLCQNKYYNNTIFHRIIPKFMMQGGDPTGTGTGGESIWKKPFKDEFDSRLLHDKRGILSMANSDRHTNKSQFFITFAECHHLDNKHTVFGSVVGGMETLDKIEQVSIGLNDKPIDDVRILNIEIYINPFDEYNEDLHDDKKQDNKEEKKQENEKELKTNGSVIKIGHEWVAADSIIHEIPTIKTTSKIGVGKYLPDENIILNTMNKQMKEKLIETKGKDKRKQEKKPFTDFSNW